ncbi:unnamed protein product [Linum trigynum]|uniref:RNase H type-1 domain-containing protein n=1 Tax=Linum trigynum TaxID=586398 RepID=A0AAV2F1S5_9ROSI
MFTAAGSIVRGGDGRFIKAFAVNLGGGSITRAELAGIVHGLRLTWETGARKVLLQTDSAAAMSIIEKATHHHPHFTAVAEIKSWLSKDWQHVYREANVVADHLASIGHIWPIGLHVFDNPDSTLAYWLYYDIIGVQTPRAVHE